MCVLAFAWNAHPRWRLVMAGNRDELHARPAAPLARWPGAGSVIAGRDLQAGGTWLGVSEQGRFAVVTNLRGYGTPAPNMASRGTLVANLLTGEGPHADPATIDLATFNPFSVLFANPEGAHFLTNRPDSVRTALASGLYGLSNGALDEPWPKTLQIKALLLGWLMGNQQDPATLLDGLMSDQLPAFGLTPDSPSDAPQEPRESPIFIRNPVYGTRCSTVVMIDTEGQGQIIERRFDAAGRTTGESRQPFSWPPSQDGTARSIRPPA